MWCNNDIVKLKERVGNFGRLLLENIQTSGSNFLFAGVPLQMLIKYEFDADTNNWKGLETLRFRKRMHPYAHNSIESSILNKKLW